MFCFWGNFSNELATHADEKTNRASSIEKLLLTLVVFFVLIKFSVNFLLQRNYSIRNEGGKTLRFGILNSIKFFLLFFTPLNNSLQLSSAGATIIRITKECTDHRWLDGTYASIRDWWWCDRLSDSVWW